MNPLCLFLLDQGIPIEYELDKFNTPHTGTTLFLPPNCLCRLRCLIPPRHLATTSPRGHIFWRPPTLLPEITRNTNSRWLQSLFPPTANMTFAAYCEHTSLARPTTRAAILNYHNLQSFTYFFPFPRSLQHKRKLNIPCCPLKTIIKTFRFRTSWNFSPLYTLQT